MAIHDAAGNAQDIELPGPGGTIRVAVGEPGCRSSVWRVWANSNKSDVYIAARVIAGVQKFSLHESGDWRFQWINQDDAERFTTKRDRVIDAWPRPGSVGAGWTKGISIWVPAEDVVPLSDDPETLGGKVWLPRPDGGIVTGIHVVVAKPDQGFTALKGAIPIEAFTLANGEVVLVVTSLLEPTDEQVRWLEEQRKRAVGSISESLTTVDGDPRMTLFAHEEDGTRAIWDLSLERSLRPG